MSSGLFISTEDKME